MTVFWIASLPVMRCGVSTTSQYQNRSPQSGDMGILICILTRQSAVHCLLVRKDAFILDFLESGQTINSNCYIMALTKLKSQMSRFRPQNKITFLLQNDDTRFHTSLKTMERIASLASTVLSHSWHILDLVPSDFDLFKLMKDELCEQHFLSNNTITVAVKSLLVQIFTAACSSLLAKMHN